MSARGKSEKLRKVKTEVNAEVVWMVRKICEVLDKEPAETLNMAIDVYSPELSSKFYDMLFELFITRTSLGKEDLEGFGQGVIMSFDPATFDLKAEETMLKEHYSAHSKLVNKGSRDRFKNLIRFCGEGFRDSLSQKSAEQQNTNSSLYLWVLHFMFDFMSMDDKKGYVEQLYSCLEAAPPVNDQPKEKKDMAVVEKSVPKTSPEPVAVNENATSAPVQKPKPVAPSAVPSKTANGIDKHSAQSDTRNKQNGKTREESPSRLKRSVSEQYNQSKKRRKVIEDISSSSDGSSSEWEVEKETLPLAKPKSVTRPAKVVTPEEESVVDESDYQEEVEDMSLGGELETDDSHDLSIVGMEKNFLGEILWHVRDESGRKAIVLNKFMKYYYGDLILDYFEERISLGDQ